jgi:hypothetical protein
MEDNIRKRHEGSADGGGRASDGGGLPPGLVKRDTVPTTLERPLVEEEVRDATIDIAVGPPEAADEITKPGLWHYMRALATLAIGNVSESIDCALHGDIWLSLSKLQEHAFPCNRAPHACFAGSRVVRFCYLLGPELRHRPHLLSCIKRPAPGRSA